jgi:hypothetical protein
MSEGQSPPDEPETEGFGDRKGVIIGLVIGLVILSAFAAVVGHREVVSMGGRLLGLLGLK